MPISVFVPSVPSAGAAGHDRANRLKDGSMERRSEGKRDKMRRDNETYGEERRTSVMVVIQDIKE